MWSRRCSNWAVLIGLGVLECACSTSHVATRIAAPVAVESSAPTAAALPVTPPPPPPRATADFARAVQLVKAGRDDEATLEFQQIAVGYPTYPGALVNLGLLYRRHGDLVKADQSLHAAIERDPTDAEAWCELGVTLRLEGKFHDAVDAYNRAISVNPNFAAAHRNLAIVQDLYLGQTAAALAAMQHYKDLGGEDKALTGWLADLKQRAAKSAVSPAPSVPGKAGG